ncbi:MAG: LL-diaminopimelate aminotransferase [Firmicutes bacterium]|nr:LL-diaminopimelate aminotransferase [Bacillota bacterium]
MREAVQLQKLPPYLFARIEQKVAEAREKGIDVINLGIGDPDRPTPAHIVAKAMEQVQNPPNHRYPTSVGLLEYRQAVADWYRRRFGVELNPRSEVVSLIGSKEGIAHIAFCYLNPGDLTLVPDPGYPVYGIGTLLANGEPYIMPLRAENGFLPELDAIPAEVARKAKIMYLNYPNNPTGALADAEFFERVVAFARKYDILVCHDAAYSEIAFDGVKPLSFLQIPGAKEVGIEFHSVSKTYNMTGWRIGWAVGNPQAIEVLSRFKSNVDSGVFQAVQYAAVAALNGPQDCVDEMRRVYQERRDVLIDGLNAMGWQLEKPKATIYVWIPVPKGYNSTEFAELVLEKAAVVITPGIGYGAFGDRYFRVALTVEKERIQEAVERMKATLGQIEL